MDKYLLEILKNVNTIIIPGLGALTITNHDTGEIMFMPYLKHDDGKLTQYIVENERFEELEAKNLIAKYVREIQLTLDKGESYEMFQFGTFFKDGEDIEFKNWEGTTKSEEAEVIPLKEIEDSTEKVEEDISAISTVSITMEKEVTPIIEKKVEEDPIEKKDPIVVHLKEDVQEPAKELNILEKEERAATAAKLEKLRSDKLNPVAKKKKGAAFWMLMTLIVLIVAGGTYFGLNYDRLKQHVPFLEDTSTFSTGSNTAATEESETDKSMAENSETEEESDSNTEMEEESEETEPIEQVEKIIETPPTSSGSDLPFHIIAGAFSSEANATRLGGKLRGEGYTVKVGPGRGMTLVSVKSFSTKEEAQQGLSELKSVVPNGWVYEWK